MHFGEDPKFWPGNKVKVINGNHCVAAEEEAVITEISDAWGRNGPHRYGIVTLSGGSPIWWLDEPDLEFLDVGGPHLFKEARRAEERKYKFWASFDKGEK